MNESEIRSAALIIKTIAYSAGIDPIELWNNYLPNHKKMGLNFEDLEKYFDMFTNEEISSCQKEVLFCS